MKTTHAPAETLRAVRDAIRHPYAWPGGYPRYTILRDDGALLCPDCARSNYRLISSATRGTGAEHGWAAAGADVLWEYEDDAPTCAHCGIALESAYGIVGKDN